MHLNCCISVKSLVRRLITHWNTMLVIRLWIQSSLNTKLQLVFLNALPVYFPSILNNSAMFLCACYLKASLTNLHASVDDHQQCVAKAKNSIISDTMKDDLRAPQYDQEKNGQEIGIVNRPLCKGFDKTRMFL